MRLMTWLLTIALATAAGIAQADDLCAINPYTKSDAEKGKAAFDSHCAYCHQYNMSGRLPGNFLKESPDIGVLSASDVKFVDGNGGTVPPLIGDAFFKKQQTKTLVEFSSQVGGAAQSFPTKSMTTPDTYFWLAAYVLYRNCGKL